MWWDIINDDALLRLFAKPWILPVAAGYLPLNIEIILQVDC